MTELPNTGPVSSILEEYFQDWYESHGQTLDPDEIYEDVKRPGHPLHGRYEWDKNKAHREYVKLQIARDIRMVKVQFVSPEDGTHQQTRAYLNNRDIGKRAPGYTAANEALQSAEAVAMLEASFHSQLKSLERQFKNSMFYKRILDEFARRASGGGDGEPNGDDGPTLTPVT